MLFYIYNLCDHINSFFRQNDQAYVSPELCFTDAQKFQAFFLFW